MKFSTREDIEAPIDHVFAMVTDFDGFERQALRRGAEVQRVDAYGKPGIGSEWDMKFEFRGKMRSVNARMTQFEAPNGFAADTVSGGLSGKLTLELLSLSPRRTRMNVAIDLKPNTLSARLLIQSLKFAKGNVSRRFSNRVWQFAQDIEQKHTSTA